MRTLLELLIAAAIIALAWEKPLKEKLPWTTTPPPQAVATPTPPGAWMNDPNRRTKLDTAAETPVRQDKSALRDPNHQTPLDAPSKIHATATPR